MLPPKDIFPPRQCLMDGKEHNLFPEARNSHLLSFCFSSIHDLVKASDIYAKTKSLHLCQQGLHKHASGLCGKRFSTLARCSVLGK